MVIAQDYEGGEEFSSWDILNLAFGFPSGFLSCILLDLFFEGSHKPSMVDADRELEVLLEAFDNVFLLEFALFHEGFEDLGREVNRNLKFNLLHNTG